MPENLHKSRQTWKQGPWVWRSNIVFVVLLCLFCLVGMTLYFHPNSSRWMVDEAANQVVVLAGFGAVLLAAVLYGARLLLSAQDSLRLGTGGLVVMVGGLFIQNVFGSTPLGFLVYVAAILLCVAAVQKRQNRLDLQNLGLLVVVFGCALRIAFAMALPAYMLQHDMTFGDGPWGAYGHAEFIVILAQTGRLPESNHVMLYHAPLFHILGAVFYKFHDLLGMDYFRFSENLQHLTALFSCLTLVAWYKILYQLKFGKVAFLTALGLLAFHPTFFIIGNCINNDVLVWLFVSICILYLIKWMKNPGYKNILLMAASLGLAMMSKVSAVLILAPVIGTCFLIYLLPAIKAKKGAGRLLGQFAAFGALSIPLGMWYPVRNLVKFGQSFGYVPLPGNENSLQYIGNVPLLNRLLPLDLGVLRTPFVLWNNEDWSILFKTVKTSLFAENFVPRNALAQGTVAYLISALAYLLIVISIIAIVYVLKKCRPSTNWKFYAALAGIYLIQLVSYIYFCIQYPWQCTMDARYIVVNICISAVFIGKLAGLLLAGRTKAKRALGWGVVACVGLFCLCSIFIFGTEVYRFDF